MKILVDSDALFGLSVAKDAHHKTATKIFNSLPHSTKKLALNLTIQESATVISNKIGQQQAKDFISNLPNLNLEIIPLHPDIESRAWEFFTQQTKKGTSFVDCANAATLEYYQLDSIFSFDTFYSHLNLPVLK